MDKNEIIVSLILNNYIKFLLVISKCINIVNINTSNFPKWTSILGMRGNGPLPQVNN